MGWCSPLSSGEGEGQRGREGRGAYGWCSPLSSGEGEGRGRGEGRATCDVVLTLRTWKYIERELPRVPLSIPVIILVSGHAK